MEFTCLQLDTIACEVNHNIHKALIWGNKAFENGAKYVLFHEGVTSDYTSDPIKYGRELDSWEVYGFSQKNTMAILL